MLSDLPTLKTFAQIPDTSQDSVLTQILLAADAAIKRYCKRDLETNFYTGAAAEYRDGNGYKDLWLYQKPIILSPPQTTGIVTQGSAIISGLNINAQTYLSVGMPVQVTGPVAQSVQGAFPQGTTISTINSTSQVTCSAAATAGSANAINLIFGLRVYLNPGGFYGDGFGGFSTGPGQIGIEMFLGLNYTVRRGPTPASSSVVGSPAALITRLGGGMIGSTIAGVWPGDWPQGFLSAKEGPYWPRGIGNIKIEYSAGIGVGAPVGGTLQPNVIPYELTAAVNGLATWMWRNANSGLKQMASASFLGYSASIETALRDSPELGGVRALLSHYREVAF